MPINWTTESATHPWCGILTLSVSSMTTLEFKLGRWWGLPVYTAWFVKGVKPVNHMAISSQRYAWKQGLFETKECVFAKETREVKERIRCMSTSSALVLGQLQRAFNFCPGQSSPPNFSWPGNLWKILPNIHSLLVPTVYLWPCPYSMGLQ